MNCLPVLVLAASLFPPHAIGFPELERVLLPIVTRSPLPGAFGSLWETVLTARNASTETSALYPPHCPPPTPERFCAQAGGTELPAGETVRLRPLLSSSSGPVFLNVTKSLADRIFVQLRVHDLTRQAESFGTEIPVIRASEMKRGAGEILDVPLTPRFRPMLRIYADEVASATDLIVRFVGSDEQQVHEMRFTVPPRSADVPAREPVVQPALYAVVSDFASFEELRGATSARIEFRAENPELRYWAFVSVTNNDTQQITTLSLH